MPTQRSYEFYLSMYYFFVTMFLWFQPCIIVDCGELSTDSSTWNINENDNTCDVYPPFPEDWKIQPSELDVIV